MNPAAPKITVSKEEMKALSDIAVEIQKAFKAFDYYPEGHAALSSLIDKSYEKIKGIIESRDNQTFTVKSRGFFSGFHQVGKEINTLEQLAREFYIRGIRKFFLLTTLKKIDFATFLRTVHMTQGELKQKGGIDRILAEAGVDTIWVNEIKYDRLQGKDLEYRGETNEVTSQSHSKIEAPALETVSFSANREEVAEEPEDEKNEVLKEQESNFHEIILELKSSPDAKRYRELLGMAIPLSLDETGANNYYHSFELVRTLVGHLEKMGEDHSGNRASICDTIDRISSPPLLSHLVERLCSREGSSDVPGILLQIGIPALNLLLDTMAKTEELSARKKIATAIKLFGSHAEEEISRRLDDERWYVVRNIVVLLGEIGTLRTLDIIEPMLGHRDDRVKKEAIRAIGKIGGQESASLLVESFESIEASLRSLAVFSMGLIGNEHALPLLEKVASRKGLSAGDEGQRKEAVLAIGKIKNSGGIHVLEEILLSEGLFNKESEELRIASAGSIRSIGGKEAVSALEKGLNTKNANVKACCQKFLRQLK